ncbi:DUF2442 domain-containing protein [Tianweitania sp.]|uniref:DUF2442 domain-containing protein n=1 Tax=Tianweitania sp. TaxID=2021634 RepID=UPI00289BBA04|nr:DUF2442 domain-containing protein [Tianweitania sp.]
MDSVTDADLAAAEARGRQILETEPRAEHARFNVKTRRIEIELINGCSYAFPAALVEDLQDADEADLEIVEIEGGGLNLHWPRLDVDLYVPALIAGIFGTRTWMNRALARHAGRQTSSAKAAAARANGAKGGRPKKVAGS